MYLQAYTENDMSITIANHEIALRNSAAEPCFFGACTNHPLAMSVVQTAQLGSVLNLGASNDAVYNAAIPNLNSTGRER